MPQQEARYEAEGGTTPLMVRRGAWWSVLAGGFYTYVFVYTRWLKRSTPHKIAWGDWVRFSDARVVNGQLIVRTPWKPSSGLNASARDSVIREALAGKSRLQHMQFGLAHGALEPQQESVVEVSRVVHPVLIEDQRVGDGADLEQPMPVRRIARQARDFQPEHDPGVPDTDLGHQALEALAICRRSPGLSEVRVNHDDPLLRPSQGDCPLAQTVLALGALGVRDGRAEPCLPGSSPPPGASRGEGLFVT
jgi:hypothetical protein